MKEQFVEEKIEEKILNENEDIIHINEPLPLNIDEKYQYIKEGKLFTFFSNLLYYGVAFPVLTILNKIIYDLKIEGKENIRDLQKGAISVSNHVLVLDCTMIGLAFGLRKVYFTTRKESFKIPVVRKLIKLLRAVPIPTEMNNKECFIKQLDDALQKGRIIHFYPEKALWPYYEKIRNFKSGAFNFAIRNNVPVIPIVITFRNPKGIRKILKKKKDVTIKILKPITYRDKYVNKKDNIDKLKEQVHQVMEKNY